MKSGIWLLEEMAKQSLSPENRKDHLANERTFLAWIRTCIGIMAFGFVVEKFALFIRQIAYFLTSHHMPAANEAALSSQSSSSIFGVFLVGVGAILALLAFFNYKKTERQIEAQVSYSSTSLAIAVTTVVLIMGVFLVIYLINEIV